MHISQITLNLINSLRDCVRHDEGGGGQCANVVQELLMIPGFEDAHSTAGYFVTDEGNIIDDHWWLVMDDDDSILDPTQDQFGEGGFGDTVHLSKKDPRHEHYFPYSGEPGIPVDVLQLADKIRARKRTTKNKTFDEMTEAFGGRPVGDPNSQSGVAMPAHVTDGGQEAVPQDPHDEEFKSEEFEDEIRQHMTDDESADLTLDDLQDKKVREVDHPEFMPSGDETHGYDPNYDPQAQERAPNTNTGHPKP